METRVITFRKLKEVCDYKTQVYQLCYKLVDTAYKDKCTAATALCGRG